MGILRSEDEAERAGKIPRGCLKIPTAGAPIVYFLLAKPREPLVAASGRS